MAMKLINFVLIEKFQCFKSFAVRDYYQYVWLRILALCNGLLLDVWVCGERTSVLRYHQGTCTSLMRWKYQSHLSIIKPLNFCILSFSTKNSVTLADRERDVPPCVRHVAPAGGAVPTSAMTLKSKPHSITLSSLNLMSQMRLSVMLRNWLNYCKSNLRIGCHCVFEKWLRYSCF